jgi:glycosyltransferase involved in cell wall biosynthesis
MLKIIFDYQIFYFSQHGGPQRYFFEIATHIAKMKGFQVHIAAPLYLTKWLRRCSPDVVWGRYFPPIAKTTRIRKWLNAGLFAQMLKKHPPDILHKTNYFSSITRLPEGTRNVLTVHDMICERFSTLFRYADKIITAKTNAINQADHIICVSEHTRQDVVSLLNIPSHKITVIHHAPSLKRTPNFDHAALPEPFILYVGRRGGYKNFIRLLSAYARSKRLHQDFRIICFGGSPLSVAERECIHALGIPAETVKQVSGEDTVLAAYYGKAAAFVYPSLYEGFGIPVLEAMACGCPVVCSNTGSLPEVSGKAARFFDPYNEEDIAHALETVVYSTDRRQELIRLGTERAREFSWNAAAEKTAQVYTSLHSRQKSPT